MTQIQITRHHLLVVMGLLISCRESFASTGSSWVQKPSWTAEETSAVHRSIKEIDPSSEVSPYSPGSHNVGIDLGQIFLMGDLAKFSDAIGVQLHYTYGASELFGLDTSIGYSDHGKYSMASLLAGMRLNMTWYDKVIPYVVVGLGFYLPIYTDQNATPAGAAQPSPSSAPLSNSQPNSTSSPLSSVSAVSALVFGIHAGPGVDLQVSKNFFFGAGLTIHEMFATTKAFKDGTLVSIGGIYTSFLLHTGVTF